MLPLIVWAWLVYVLIVLARFILGVWLLVIVTPFVRSIIWLFKLLLLLLLLVNLERILRMLSVVALLRVRRPVVLLWPLLIPAWATLTLLVVGNALVVEACWIALTLMLAGR